MSSLNPEGASSLPGGDGGGNLGEEFYDAVIELDVKEAVLLDVATSWVARAKYRYAKLDQKNSYPGYNQFGDLSIALYNSANA
jgi:hypothetical protein